MKLAKSIFFTTSLALAISLPVHAQNAVKTTISPAEKSSLATVATIDAGEIIVSIVAKNKNVGSNVNHFADMMIDQHGSNLTQILEMENQLKTGMIHSSEAEKLAQEGKKDLMKLGGLKGEEFARAYAEAMVKGHEGALKLFDDKLLKTARSDEIKNFLMSTRAVVEKHLEKARQLQSELK